MQKYTVIIGVMVVKIGSQFKSVYEII